jgi:hypothetical protein
MDSINTILARFDTYDPNEGNEIGLMKRIDFKYIFHLSQLPDILKELKSSYQRLNINKILLPGYDTLYFDTPDFQMYHRQHNGKLNRYKIRHRNYIDSGTGFLEIKHKTNTNIVKKSRINILRHELQDTYNTFISSCSPYNFEQLIPSLTTKYKRISFANFEEQARLTFDIDLNFRYQNQEKEMKEIVICEVKKKPGYHKTEIENLLAEKRIKPFKISKYCIGNYFLNKSVKQNLFKEKAYYINKLINS